MEPPLGPALPERGFWLLSLAILALLLLSVTFTLVTTWLRAVNRRRDRRRAELQSTWEPVIHAVLAGHRSADDLHARITPRDVRLFLGFLMRYARRLRGAEHDVVVGLAEPYLDVIAVDLRRRSPERRAQALQTLGELGRREYEDRIVEALSDPSPLVAMTAARAVARNFGDGHAERLLRTFERFELWSIPLLVSLLRDTGTASAGALRRVLDDERRPARIRAVAASTLASLSDMPAVEIAARVARHETQIDLVIGALEIIEAVGGAEHLPCVRELLDAPEPAIRGRAVRALARLGGREDATRLRAAIDDDSTWVALHAARSLSAIGRNDLLAELASSDHPRAEAAQEVLRENGG